MARALRRPFESAGAAHRAARSGEARSLTQRDRARTSSACGRLLSSVIIARTLPRRAPSPRLFGRQKLRARCHRPSPLLVLSRPLPLLRSARSRARPNDTRPPGAAVALATAKRQLPFAPGRESTADRALHRPQAQAPGWPPAMPREWTMKPVPRLAE